MRGVSPRFFLFHNYDYKSILGGFVTRHHVFQRFLCAFPVADFRLEKDLSKKSSRFALSDNILTARLKKRINGKKSKVKLAVNQRQKLRRCLLRAARLSGRDVRTVCRLLCREFFCRRVNTENTVADINYTRAVINSMSCPKETTRSCRGILQTQDNK